MVGGARGGGEVNKRKRSNFKKNYNFFFQAEDGIRNLVRSRGLGDEYKEQMLACAPACPCACLSASPSRLSVPRLLASVPVFYTHLTLPTNREV